MFKHDMTYVTEGSSGDYRPLGDTHDSMNDDASTLVSLVAASTWSISGLN